MVNLQYLVRSARPADHSRIANLMYFEARVHRHLDWRTPLDWLGAPEYWVLEKNGIINAAMACPPDPATIAWLRLFVVSSNIPIREAWETLWETAAVPAMRGRGLTLASIVVHDWLRDLLLNAGFTEKQQIVVLEQNDASFQVRQNDSGALIRPMTPEDLPEVAALDARSFDPLWHNSLDALRFAFSQSGISMVATVDGEVLGYQISTRNPFGAHLARLAVDPRLQGRNIGYLLVQDLLLQMRRQNLHRLTVNTQGDNVASLSLYQKIGFIPTGERYTIFTTTL